MVAQKKFRIDSFVTDKAIKVSVILVTTADVPTLSAEQTVETIDLLVGDRVLLNAQTDPVDNGIWVVEQAAWNRAADWDGSRDATNGTLIISTQNGDVEIWELQTSDDPFIPGEHDGVFVAQSESGTFTINWVGYSGGVTSTAVYRRVGKMVLLSIGNLVISGTSDDTVKESTPGDLPASLTPSVSQIMGMCATADNGGSFEYGQVDIFPSATNIKVRRNIANDLWTASGTATINPINLVYYL